MRLLYILCFFFLYVTEERVFSVCWKVADRIKTIHWQPSVSDPETLCYSEEEKIDIGFVLFYGYKYLQNNSTPSFSIPGSSISGKKKK